MNSSVPFAGLPELGLKDHCQFNASELENLELMMQQSPDISTLQASAVLMIIHKYKNQWQVLFTKRADHLKHHAGQISFPGGRFDHKDKNLLQTAIRETAEEIGLDSTFFKIVGHLPSRSTLTGFYIKPYVAVAETLPHLNISDEEVSEVFSVPLNYLCLSENQHAESIHYQGKLRKYYKIQWEKKIIWGATARILVDISKYYHP